MMTKSRRLVVHIGPHKTASTYIQANLLENRSAMGRVGWVYPTEGTDGQMAHHHLAHNSDEYLSVRGPHFHTLKALREASSSGGNNIVLSAEGFCRWKPTNFDILADILGFDDYELVYAVRDPLDVFASFWAEEVKQGRSLGFAERFCQEFADPMGSRILNPMRDINPLLARERARVHAIPYDILYRRGIDIFEHLTKSILGLKEISPRISRRVNVKYQIELTEFLRLMTLIEGRGKPTIGADLRFRFTEHVSESEQLELRKLVQENASLARRVIKVPGDVLFRIRVEQVLKNRLQTFWSVEVGQDEPLFSAEPRRYVYYDAYLLSMTEPVRSAADALVQRLSGLKRTPE
jgi:hypothetical protein